MLHLIKLGVCLACLAIVLPSTQASAYLPQTEARKLCRQRTGLVDHDIVKLQPRNEKCAIDCITKQGTLMTAIVDDGLACHDQDGYKCLLGKCRAPDEKIDAEMAADLHLVNLGVSSAYVADRDPYPLQGKSDAFVVIETVSNSEPSFRDGEVICHTHVVQDTSSPVWNFACKRLPLKSSSKLRFVVMDSDKPDTDPQLLGTNITSVGSLMNSGPRTLVLDSAFIPGGPYWLRVEVTGTKYDAKE